MAKQSLAVTLSSGSAASAAAELIASATARVYLTRIKIFSNTATQCIFGIGRPAATGITPTSPVTLLAHDTADQSPTASVAVAWGTGPTIPAAYMYIAETAAVAGSGVDLEFSEGIVIAPGKSLVLWNIGAGADNGICDVTFEVSTTPAAQTRQIR